VATRHLQQHQNETCLPASRNFPEHQEQVRGLVSELISIIDSQSDGGGDDASLVASFEYIVEQMFLWLQEEFA